MRSYVVRVDDVPKYYAPGYFPRKFRYKQDALDAAELAVNHGASMARVECPNGGEIDVRPSQRATTTDRVNLFG